MFVGGIGSHLKVSQVDQSVCLGNELNNLSARKDFLLKNIKSSHPTHHVLLLTGSGGGAATDRTSPIMPEDSLRG